MNILVLGSFSSPCILFVYSFVKRSRLFHGRSLAQVLIFVSGVLLQCLSKGSKYIGNRIVGMADQIYKNLPFYFRLTIDVINCTSISSTPSCRRLYRVSADGDALLFSVCLFVCRPPHSGHLSESVFFHLKRFAAVASCCCWKALLTNVK